MVKIRIYYKYGESNVWDLEKLANKKLAEYGIEIDFIFQQERQEKKYIEKVSDNVERAYSNRIDGTIVRRGAALLIFNL
jgi:hypothetical protein